MDPFSSVPVFLSLTRKFSEEKRCKASNVAVLVATGVLVGFLFLGPVALELMGIRLESFEIGGGILMLIIAISFALGIDYGGKGKTPAEAVIIGVPLLSGPGTMLTVVLLANTLGFMTTLLAGLAACAACYLILLSSSRVYRLAGRRGLDILSRVSGVLLAAFAVEYIRRGFGI
jgi:multiple antibiotic resistance protein